MRKIISKIKRATKLFLFEERGVSAVEFALIAPVMVAFLLGAIEVNLLLTADRKVTQLTSTIADLVAQDDVITADEMDDIFTAASAILQPYSPAPLKMRVTSVVMDEDGDATVAWSQGKGMTALSPGSSISTPDGILQNNTSVIMAQVTYDYDSLIGSFVNTNIQLDDTFYLRPRRSASVTGP
jgi:Flp pilus assembly protein TadG